MRRIEKVELYHCHCSNCGSGVVTSRGVDDLQSMGWHVSKDDLLCPACTAYFTRIPVILHMPVFSLITDASRGLFTGHRYYVCDIVKSDPHAVFVDVGNGWQARLNVGEWDLDYPTEARLNNQIGCF